MRFFQYTGCQHSGGRRSCGAYLRDSVWASRSPLFVIGFLAFVCGCSTQDAAPKASHFEHDHEVADHWPSDLADAAGKMRERLVWIETGEVPEHDLHDEHDDDHHEHEHEHEHNPIAEIADLVSWVPEVAADTNLSEADWLPLHHAADSMMANLRAGKDDLSSDNRSQIESLCQLIDDSVTKIPEQHASLKVMSP